MIDEEEAPCSGLAIGDAIDGAASRVIDRGSDVFGVGEGEFVRRRVGIIQRETEGMIKGSVRDGDRTPTLLLPIAVFMASAVAAEEEIARSIEGANHTERGIAPGEVGPCVGILDYASGKHMMCNVIPFVGGNDHIVVYDADVALTGTLRGGKLRG